MVTATDLTALHKEGAETFAAVKAHPVASLMLLRFTDVPGMIRRAAEGDETSGWALLTIESFMTKHGKTPFQCCLCGAEMETPTHAGAVAIFAPEFKPEQEAAITVTCMRCAGGDFRELRDKIMAMAGVAPILHEAGHA